MKVVEGHAPFVVGDETFETYYKVVGDLENRTKTPLVLLHGGPSFAHNYLLSCVDLNASFNIPLVFYDQLGSGGSVDKRLPDKPYEFWSVNLMIDELINLLLHLGIEHDFDLLGHSWGGVLAMEFVVRRRSVTKGLRRLVLASAFAETRVYNESFAALVDAFSDDVKKALYGGLTTENAARFKRALYEVFAVHGCRVPWTDDLRKGLDEGFENATAHNALWDHGELRTYTIVDRAHAISVPTLITNGRWDICPDVCQVPLFRNIPVVKWVRFEGSSHTPFLEERERFMAIVERFLNIS